MHRIETAGRGVLVVTLAGRTTVDDYEATIPVVESQIEARDNLRVIWDMCALEAVEPQAIWRDVVFDMRHRDDLGRIAIIGSKAWEKWATRMFRPAPTISIRSFRADERDVADQWVRS